MIRAELPPLPARVAKLPVDERGYPVPWFVTWIDGKPEFRVADARKARIAIEQKRCWVCGGVLGATFAFTVGPMCAINLVSAEPPSHVDCAEFSAKGCPFLSRPHMRRRENDLPDGATDPAGVSIRRNPGVALVWVTKAYRLVNANGGGVLFHMADPRVVRCYAEGRAATLDEIRASIDSGYPILLAEAEKGGIFAVAHLERETRRARALLGVA